MPEPDDQAQVEPLDALALAVQQFVNTQVDQPTLVDQAVVVWEQVSYDEDGTTQRQIKYAIPTDNFSMSGALGLNEAAGEYLRRDILRVREDD